MSDNNMDSQSSSWDKLVPFQPQKTETGYDTSEEEEREYIDPQIPVFVEEDSESVESQPREGPEPPFYDLFQDIFRQEDVMGIALDCDNPTCKNEICLKGRNDINYLARFLKDGDIGDTRTKALLRLLIQHNRMCDIEINCMVPFCNKLTANFPEVDPDLMKDEVHKFTLIWREYFKHPMIMDAQRKMDYVHRFPGCGQSVELFKEVLHIEPLGDIIQAWGSFMLKEWKFVITQMYHDKVSVVQPLTAEPSPYISQHHWLQGSEQGPIQYLAKENYEHLLGPNILQRLPWTEVIVQLASIAQHVHAWDIMLCDWRGKNFCVDGGGGDGGGCRVRLYALEGCVPLGDLQHEGVADDTELLRIPPIMLPPEMWKGECKGRRSDMWGLGILLYHCITSTYPTDLHMSRAQQRQKLQEDCRVNLDAVEGIAEAKDILSELLSPDPSQRPLPEEIIARYGN